MTKLLLVFIALVLISLTVFSQPAVIIQPLSGDELVSLYSLEVKEYKLVVVNISDSALEDVQIRLIVPDELSLVVDGEDKIERFFSFELIHAGQKEERIFEVKALEVSSKPVVISANFGVNGVSNSASTSVMVVHSDFSFNSRLTRTSLEPGQSGSVVFDIINNMDEKITNIKAELVSSDSIIIDSDPLELEFLDAGQSITNTEFDFSLGTGTGEKILVLKVFFEDSKGKHLLEKSFSLDVQNRDIYVAILVIAILFLVVVSLYMRRNKPPQQVNTEGIKVQDLGKENK